MLLEASKLNSIFSQLLLDDKVSVLVFHNIILLSAIRDEICRPTLTVNFYSFADICINSAKDFH